MQRDRVLLEKDLRLKENGVVSAKSAEHNPMLIF